MPKTMMTIMMMMMMMMMMMIMTDPFTTNLVVKGPVVKGSVVKGATSVMTMITMMVMLVRIRTMMIWYHEVGYDERQNMTKRVIYIQNAMYDLEESLVLAFVCCLLVKN